RVAGMENGDTVANASSPVSADILLGIRTGPGFPFFGEMGEVLIYNRALSATERRDVERYLARKWNAPLNVASQTQGGVAFANELIAGGGYSAHQIDHLNDANYGNSYSWIGNDNGGSSAFAGVAFDGAYDISSLAFGRDATGASPDRVQGIYEFQYTTDAFDPLSLASVGSATWNDFLTVDYSSFVYGGPERLRHLFEFDMISGVRGVRVLLSTNVIAIDEFEVYGIQTIPEPSTILLGLAGLVGVCLLGRRRIKARSAMN
ncbi:MAG: PEP-CTERM sorting domain-containing protein, partial [Pirellulales bacterium]